MFSIQIFLILCSSPVSRFYLHLFECRLHWSLKSTLQFMRFQRDRTDQQKWKSNNAGIYFLIGSMPWVKFNSRDFYLYFHGEFRSQWRCKFITFPQPFSKGPVSGSNNPRPFFICFTWRLTSNISFQGSLVKILRFWSRVPKNFHLHATRCSWS